MRRPGCFLGVAIQSRKVTRVRNSWSLKLLVFASRQFALKIVDLSVRFVHILVLYEVVRFF